MNQQTTDQTLLNTADIETLAPRAVYDSETGRYIQYNGMGKEDTIFELVLNHNRVVIGMRQVQ